MASTDNAAPSDIDRQWFIVGRWQEYEGEARANLLRIIGIAAFYFVELANYHGLRLGFFEMPRVVEKQFHQSVTALAVAWTLTLSSFSAFVGATSQSIAFACCIQNDSGSAFQAAYTSA